MKIWMMKLNRKYVKQLRKDWKKFLKNLEDEAKDICCRRDQKRKQAIHDNLDEVKDKLCESNQKRNQTVLENKKENSDKAFDEV